jgi:hypothetical protein
MHEPKFKLGMAGSFDKGVANKLTKVGSVRSTTRRFVVVMYVSFEVKLGQYSTLTIKYRGKPVARVDADYEVTLLDSSAWVPGVVTDAAVVHLRTVVEERDAKKKRSKKA